MLRKNLSTEHTEGTDRWEFLVASLEILEEIFNKEWPGPEMLWIHGAHGGHGIFFSCLKARNL